MEIDSNVQVTANGSTKHVAENGSEGNKFETYRMPESLQLRLNQKNEEIGRLMSEVTRLENEVSNKNTRIRTLELLLETATDAANYAKQKADEFDRELASLRRELEQKSILLQAAVNDSIEKDKLVDQMKAKVDELDSRLVIDQANQDAFAEKDITIRNLNNKCEDLTKRLEEHRYLLGCEQNLRIEQTQKLSELEQERIRLINTITLSGSLPPSSIPPPIASTSDPMRTSQSHTSMHENSTFINLSGVGSGQSDRLLSDSKYKTRNYGHLNSLVDDVRHYFQSSPFWRDFSARYDRCLRNNKQISDVAYVAKNILRRNSRTLIIGYVVIIHILALLYIF